MEKNRYHMYLMKGKSVSSLLLPLSLFGFKYAKFRGKVANILFSYTLENRYCTAKPWPFTSKTNKVSMKFVSGASGRFEGFAATYTSSLTKGLSTC